MITKDDILEAHNRVYSVIQVANLWSNLRNDAEKAATMLRDTALQSIEPKGLGGTNITAVTSFNQHDVADGNIVISIKGGMVDIQVYKIQQSDAAVIMELAARKI